MRLVKLLIALVMAAASIAPLGVWAADSQEVYFFEDFDSYLTNEQSTRIASQKAAAVRVTEDGERNKALYSKVNDARNTLSCKFETSGRYVVASFDVKSAGGQVGLDFGILDAGSGTDVIPVMAGTDGSIRTYDGREAGGLSSGVWKKLALMVDTKNSTFSMWVDGRQRIGDWKLPKAVSRVGGFTWYVKPGAEAGEIYLDNIYAYGGDSLRKNLPASSYNPEKMEVIELQDTVGSAIFAMSDFEDQANAMAGFTPTIKDNLLEIRYDDKKQSNVLYMEKTQEADMHVDHSVYSAVSYLALEMDLKVDQFGATIYPFIVMDGATVSGKRTDDYPVYIDSKGELRERNGNSLYKMTRGKWVSLKFLYNFPARTYSVYIDGELAADRHGFYITSEDYATCSSLRTWIAPESAKAAISIDNYNVYEGKELKENFEDEMISVLPTDDAPIAYLNGKLAYHTFSGSVYNADGKVKNAEKPVEKDGDYLVSPETAELIFGTKPTAGVLDGGKVPLKRFAGSLGKNVTDDGAGLLLFSSAKLNLEQAMLDEMNHYLFFTRPTPEMIAEDYQKAGMSGVHPRVILTPAEVQRMKEDVAQDETAQGLSGKIIANADTLMLAAPAKYNLYDGYRILNISRDVRSKMEHWGYAWQMTGDKKYPERAWTELEAVFEFKDWNPQHYLDCAEMMFGVAIGYDWMYDAFTGDQRKKIEEALVKFGLNNTRDAYYGRLLTGGIAGPSAAFVTDKTNFNVVDNGGSVCAALAIADAEPELCFDIVSKAVRSLEYVLPQFQPDGGWEEGPNYWNYTINYLAKFISALDTALGTDYGIMDFQGLSSTAEFALYLDSWQGLNNFHDTWSGGHIDTSELSWLARKYDNPGLFNARVFALNNYQRMTVTPYDMVWFDRENNHPDSVGLALDNITRGIDSFSFRESWEKPDALFVSGHGGKTNAYHGHFDGGAFVFDLMGERWAIDLNPEEYNIQSGKSLEIWYRRRAEAHNTVVIDPDASAGQVFNSEITVDKYESKSKGAFIIQNMSELYTGASSFRRGFYVGDERRSLTVRDEITLNKASDIYWFLHTKAAIEIDGSTAILTQNGKKLKVEFVTNGTEAQFVEMEDKPMDTSPDPEGQTPVTDSKRLAIKAKGSGAFTLEVKLSGLGEPASKTAVMNLPLSEWTIPDGDLIERGDLSLKQIFADGKPLSGFKGTTTNYTLGVLEGTPMPEITADSGGLRTEIKKAASIDDTTVITVYDAHDLYSMTYTISYTQLRLPADVAGYGRYVVPGLEVSSTPEPQNYSYNMLDGDLTTRWSGNGSGEYAVFDLGETKPIAGIAYSYWKGNERSYSFDILVSDDGARYEKVYSGASSGTTEDYEIIPLSGIQGRYVRLVGYGNTENLWNNLQEFAILYTK